MAALGAFPGTILLPCALVYAQDTTDQNVAACAACGSFLFVLLAVLVINILIMVWVARDAKARDMSSPVGWLILIFLTGIIGLIIFILSRPTGDLEPCPHCGNRRMRAMMQCPHCGNR